MAYEVLVASDKKNNERTGSRSVTFLIRQNADVKAAEVVLAAEDAAAAFGESNAAALFAGGVVPQAETSPLALFYAVQSRLIRGYLLNAIYKSFRQFKLGGDLSAMVVAGREALGENDEQFEEWEAFEAVYAAGSSADRLALDAMVTWVVTKLTAAK